MILRVVTATLAVALLVALSAYAWLRMPLRAPIGDEAAVRALAFARATLEHAAIPALSNEEADQRGLPVIVSLFDAGHSVARAVGYGDTFGAALRDAVARLNVDAATLARGRLKLDRVIGRGHLARSIAPMLAFGTVPGRDGIGGERGGARAFMTADDLLRAGAWGRYVPVPSMEFSFGLDPAHVLRALTNEIGSPERIFRFRAEEYVESLPDHHALPVVAGRVPGPPLTKASLLSAAHAGGAYLLAHLDAQGHFDYEYFTIEDERVGGESYSLPRHAGATSFLAKLYGVEHDEALRAAAARAIDYLARQRPAGCDGERVCVGGVDDPLVDLGSSALSLVAATEYARATQDERYVPFEEGLTRFLLFMQKSDGEFCHLFTPSSQARDEHTQLLYYSGEAAYALGLVLQRHATLHSQTNDAAISSALDRSLHYLTDTQYANLAGQFYVGEDHWTCMALDAGWPFLPADHREHYAKFCDAFAQFMRKTQFLPGDALVAAQPQLRGAYGVAAAMAPHNTPVGSRSESVISIWHLGTLRNLAADDPRVREPREQVEEGMRYLLANQIGDDAYLMTNLPSAKGGFLMSDSERHVRIDFVQHAGCSLLRAIDLL